jgi:hypothetical protein
MGFVPESRGMQAALREMWWGAGAKVIYSPTGVSSGRLNRAMFPLVLPTPLSKKWGAKLAWARKSIQAGRHTDTQRDLCTSVVTHQALPASGQETAWLP